MRNTARLGPMPSTLDSIDDYDRGHATWKRAKLETVPFSPNEPDNFNR